MGVRSGYIAIEDDRSRAVDGEETGTRCEGIVRVGLSGGDVDAASARHVDDAVGRHAIVYEQLTAAEGEARREDVEATQPAEVGIAGNAENPGVDRGGTQVGIRPGENQSAEARLGQAGLPADVGEVTADRAGRGQGGGRPHINRAGLNQLHVVGDREILVPTSQGAGVEEDVAREIARGTERQGASADGCGGIAVRCVGEPKNTRSGLDQGG